MQFQKNIFLGEETKHLKKTFIYEVSNFKKYIRWASRQFFALTRQRGIWPKLLSSHRSQIRALACRKLQNLRIHTKIIIKSVFPIRISFHADPDPGGISL